MEEKKKYFNSGWNPIFVCPSQWLADKVKEPYLGQYEVEVILNDVDIEIVKPKNKDIVRKKYEISTIKKFSMNLILQK